MNSKVNKIKKEASLQIKRSRRAIALALLVAIGCLIVAFDCFKHNSNISAYVLLIISICIGSLSIYLTILSIRLNRDFKIFDEQLKNYELEMLKSNILSEFEKQYKQLHSCQK